MSAIICVSLRAVWISNYTCIIVSLGGLVCNSRTCGRERAPVKLSFTETAMIPRVDHKREILSSVTVERSTYRRHLIVSRGRIFTRTRANTFPANASRSPGWANGDSAGAGISLAVRWLFIDH